MNAKVFVLCVVITGPALAGTTPKCPFTRGFNLGGWFEVESAQQIPNWYKRTDFENITALGCDHIRLPIRLFSMCGSEPDYLIDPILLKQLDRTVDWAEEVGVHIILDNHNTSAIDATNSAITNRLIAVWQQMAEHFKDRIFFVHPLRGWMVFLISIATIIEHLRCTKSIHPVTTGHRRSMCFSFESSRKWSPKINIS